jgi:proton-translocating NADH-quinone oxidoreductase chain L
MSWQVSLYAAVVLIPLLAFVIEILFIRQLKHRTAILATGAIGLSCVLSLVGLVDYLIEAPGMLSEAQSEVSTPEDGHEPQAAASETHHGQEHRDPLVWKSSFDWVVLGGSAASPPNGAASEKPAVPSLVIPLGIAIDNLSVLMFAMVTFIATLVHIYSMEYMHDDPRYPRFFAYLSLFCFSMLGLLASPNVFMIFIFWELVGVCSYLLIGFWYEERPNCDAANKAFVVNRVGDVGMLIGLGLLWTSLGTFDFQTINRGLRDSEGHFHTGTGEDGTQYVALQDPHTGQAIVDPATGQPRQIAYWALTIAGLGVFAGCVGKSAQFPLHVWLPDAMAGPTPVSALIHAATMVAAGVYLVGRFFPLFTPGVLLYIAYTGGITLFVAATIAVVQTDYKKVLAYSTISQLGFMILGLGVGGWAAGLFHLITHAFFKALLFLCAGSVYHSVHTYEMPALGGLYRRMPITSRAMLVGTLAISGVPFFSGFYSKDAILAAALNRAWQSPEHTLLFILPALGAVITAFYMFRMWLLVFAGEARGFASQTEMVHAHAHDEERELAREQEEATSDSSHAHGHLHDQNPALHAHESRPAMAWPLIVLAVLSVISGWTLYLGVPLLGTPVLESLLEYGEPLVPHGEHLTGVHGMALLGSLLIAAIGIGLAFLYYAPPGLPYFVSTRLSAARVAERFRGVHNFLKRKWYFDELYWAIFVRPCLAFARICRQLDQILIDGLVNGLAQGMALLSRLEGLFDNLAVDGLVNLTAKGVYLAGDRSRGIQTGKLRNYLMFLAVALVGLFAGALAWVRGS